MSIPQLSQEMIRRYASSQSWQRGEAYYHDGYVRRVVKRGNAIAAEVEGNDIRPYQVSIGFEGEELGTVYCSCPYDYGGICKHIVATLLVCLHEPEIIELRPSLEAILDRLNEVQTQNLIQELVADKPELINDIEHFADRVAPPVVIASSQESKPQRQITVDGNRIRSQVRYILRDAVNHYEYGGEEDIATEEICSLIQDAQMYTQRGDTWNAVAMLTAITEACIENWDLVDDYGVEYCEVAEALNTVWCETILSADITDISEAEIIYMKD
ncbi:MAG: SWIM zinc finger family protein [Xenococcaceae cyanobacterium MO_188.B32]|nr:SWIM zinc finger family protein [Xenococcaceae cyanobacterium MO_188.B32]